MTETGFAATLQDAAALADAWGTGTTLGLGHAGADIIAPNAITITSTEARLAINTSADRYFFAFGNSSAPPDLAFLAPLLDFCTGTVGFMAASFAAPGLGRTVFQGHLFQGGRLVANLAETLSLALEGRVAVVAHDVVAAGPQAIRRRLAAAREQGVALALIDAIDWQDCSAIAQALESSLLVGGPAWLSNRPALPAAPAPQAANFAVLSGALDRQTLFQLAAARNAMNFLQLNFAAPGVAADAIAWATTQAGSYIIAASAPPDRVDSTIDAASILGEIAAGIKAGNLVITGNDTASNILRHLGVKNLTAAATTPSALRWFQAGERRLLLKPTGAGSKNLFLDEFGPQIRLNAAAQ